jgi:hypothetical protein
MVLQRTALISYNSTVSLFSLPEKETVRVQRRSTKFDTINLANKTMKQRRREEGASLGRSTSGVSPVLMLPTPTHHTLHHHGHRDIGQHHSSSCCSRKFGLWAAAALYATVITVQNMRFSAQIASLENRQLRMYKERFSANKVVPKEAVVPPRADDQQQKTLEERVLTAAIKLGVVATTTNAAAMSVPIIKTSKTATAAVPIASDTTSNSIAGNKHFAHHGSEQLVSAPRDSSVAFQDMEATCTLKRYPYLIGKFCDHIDRSVCDLKAFKLYFKNHSSDENLIGGCPLAEAICYAKRYPDLFHAFCDGSDFENCDYYRLLEHYQQRGMKERRVWGCDFEPIQPAAKVSRRQPAVTTNTLPVSSKYGSVIGKAPLQVFQGSWEPVEFNEHNTPSKSICPRESIVDPFCNLTAREGYQPARYTANGLPEWSAKRFKEAMIEDGGRIAFVGDSLMYQLYSELLCLAEAENETLRFWGPGSVYFQEALLVTLPEPVHEQFQNIKPTDRKPFSMEWVDKVIEKEIKYLVFNTGAWWDPSTFVRRSKWCEHGKFGTATQEELISIYIEAMEQTLLPIFTNLVQNHGIIPIWIDVHPGGKLDLTTGENVMMNDWAKFYRLAPRLNEVGRTMMVQAGGWVLPTWDSSFPRSMDHLFTEGKNPQVDDQLHWCARYHNSVPAVWVQLLAQVLYGNDEIKYTNNISSSSSNRPSSSLQRIKEENRRAFVQDSSNSVTSTKPFVRFTQTNEESTCGECAQSTNVHHCRASIRCSWSDESASCSERSL